MWYLHNLQPVKMQIASLLHSLPIPNRPWQSIGLDFMGPLPKSNNFDYLLVMIDQLTVRGRPISHFHCSSFHPTLRLELHSALLFKSELHSTPISELRSTLKLELRSTFTSEVTADVKELVYVHPELVRGPCSVGSVCTE